MDMASPVKARPKYPSPTAPQVKQSNIIGMKERIAANKEKLDILRTDQNFINLVKILYRNCGKLEFVNLIKNSKFPRNMTLENCCDGRQPWVINLIKITCRGCFDSTDSGLYLKKKYKSILSEICDFDQDKSSQQTSDKVKYILYEIGIVTDNKYIMLNFKGVEFDYSGFDPEWQINLKYADLSRSDLTGANLKNVNLQSANLRRTNLSHSNLQHANLNDTDLSYSNFSNADLFKSRLIGAIFQYTNWPHACLVRANLRHAFLGGANFTHADLRGAYLFGAKGLRRANLNYSNLNNINLYGYTSEDPGEDSTNKKIIEQALEKNKELNKVFGRAFEHYKTVLLLDIFPKELTNILATNVAQKYKFTGELTPK